jgi:5-formyltetrahydrofolate cyclo-ligase
MDRKAAVMTKAELRKIYLEKRRRSTPNERREMSRKISETFFENTDLRGVRLVHCFLSIGRLNEIDTSFIISRIWADHPQITTVVPRIDPVAGTLESVAYRDTTELIINDRGIAEPSTDETVDEPDIDAVIVPLLTFDTSGHRVGYGGGYYDRFLAACRPDCLKVGLSYFPPVGRIDIAGHDVRLDTCITPQRAYKF